MARTTTDPKPKALTIRLSADDWRALSRLARVRKTSRGDVVRQLLRAEASQGER